MVDITCKNIKNVIFIKHIYVLRRINMLDREDREALSEEDRKEMALLASGHLAGTRSDEEFEACLSELQKQFPDKKIEELQAMCYDLFDQDMTESKRKNALI